MARDIYREFLELCAFEGEELDKMVPVWEKYSALLGLSEEDVRFALDEWIPKYWDIQYLGVRKMIGAYIREAIEIAKTPEYKEQGVKIVYGILPAILTNYQAMKIAGGDDIFVSFPDMQLVTILNSFFHKVDDYLDSAEETGMTYGCRHCALNKTRIGAFQNKVIAAPDVIWSWGFNCDEGPKTDEYINCLLDEDWKYVISRIPHDTHFGTIDDEDEDRVIYMAEQMRDGQREIEEMTGIKVTKENMLQAVKEQGRYAFKFSTLTQLVANGNPQPLSGSALTNFGQGMTCPFNSGLEYIEEALDIMIRECRQAKKAGTGILPKDAPKVASYFVPFCVPWVDGIFKENGVGTTFSLTFTVTKKQLEPTKYEDPYMQAAEQWLKMAFGQNIGYESKNMIEKVEANKPVDGLLMGFFDFDRWLGAHQKMCAKIIQDATGVPTFYMDSDFWEDSDYSPEALRTRIESVCQVVKMRKEMGM